ncbi:NAD(P)/FAD-dependent oxidoreductase [Microcella humidisoli]|uniref:FAD-dependent oxidoreductase n=1 Tax=Microcella humidisoli TaxID=2963406 RepID=A0ABY5FU06_9MICO|nr:FAD-dependent oxidoreductase [Microcella humidisoli]UTT61631.1 FAD-dependent oxidoreductase [Microcella humidisoli]
MTTGIADATLIIGASQAGVQLAATLRELGDDRPIVLVGDEPHAPYQRPPLSKAYLSGEITSDDLVFRTPEWFAQHHIEVLAGETIAAVDRHATGGGEAVTGSGRRIPFARLALTTGAEPRRLDLPGIDLPGVHYLRTADDAAAIAARLATARSLVVIGGGFIGLEVAASARKRGVAVTVLEAAPRLVGRVVSEQTSAFYLDAHRRRGIDVVLDARIASLDGTDAVTGVRLDDGTVIAADIVLVGIGVVPRIDLATQLGLQVDGGIVVDSACRTSDPSIVAAGDCAIMPNPYARGSMPMVRLESVHNALEQAKVAAATLMGQPADYRTVPWFWSDQADIKLQIAGLSTGYDATVLRGDPESEKFSVLYYRDGELIAADCINQPLDFMAVRSALGRGATVPADAAADLSTPLKKSVVEPTAPSLV